MSCFVMRRRAPPPGCVMECHDPHAGSSYPVAGSCIRSVLPRIPLLRLRGRAGVGGRLSAQRGVSRASPAASAGAQAGPHPASPASGRGACPAAVPSRRSPVLPHPACRSFIPFRSIPFRPPRRRFVTCSGTLIRAYPARAPAPAGARFAAARFARLIARARATPERRTHLSRRLHRGFFAPARTEAASGRRLDPTHIGIDVPDCKL